MAFELPWSMGRSVGRPACADVVHTAQADFRSNDGRNIDTWAFEWPYHLSPTPMPWLFSGTQNSLFSRIPDVF